MIGKSLSHFEITAELGRGGMGEVYRATDTKLRREVALKVLPAEMAASPARLERFQREAEAVAKLNHPNIVTIYSVEHADGIHFLVMELVEGESLDRVLRRGRPPLPKVLEITETIADALSAAHQLGIVHRDLKPANVMLTADGRVKILDFGLAKLAPEPGGTLASQVPTSAPTEAGQLTDEGIVLGTAPYMSPEQAQGQPADARSDIFSLGSLLYEATTGVVAFPGESSIDTLHRVIYEEPEPLADRVPDAPIQLQWILRKALAKDPGERYQSAAELAVDLRATRRDLKSDPELVTAASRPVVPLVQTAKRRSRAKLAALAAGLAGVALLAWYLGRSGPDSEPAAAPERSILPITSSGLVTTAAISPDGKHVAYTESYQGLQSLHLRQVGGARSLELIPLAQTGYWGLTFTPDGTDIVFGKKDEGNLEGAFFRISALGGPARKLVDHIDSPPSFSPDGTQFTWLRAGFPARGSSSVMIAEADGSDERVLATRTPPLAMAPRFQTAPSWSPDGRLIAVSVMSSETGLGKIVALDVDSGAETWASERSWTGITRVDWLPEGDALLAIATPEGRHQSQVWLVPFPRGEPYQITDDLRDYRIASVTADGTAFVTVAMDFDVALWAGPADGSGRPKRISHTRADGAWGFDLTGDGRIVLHTFEAGRPELAIMNLDGSGRHVLTSGPLMEAFPRVTADGRVLYSRGVFWSGELHLMALDGSDSRALASFQGLYPATDLSPDDTWAALPKQSGVWRVPLDGGEPTRLTELRGVLPAISPDGTRLAFYFSDGEALRIAVIPAEGGEPTLTLEAPAHPATVGSFLRWTGDGEALVINTTTGDRGNLWRLPLDGGEPRRLTNFTEERLFWYEYTADGQTLLVSSGQFTRDAVLIRDFR